MLELGFLDSGPNGLIASTCAVGALQACADLVVLVLRVVVVIVIQAAICLPVAVHILATAHCLAYLIDRLCKSTALRECGPLLSKRSQTASIVAVAAQIIDRHCEGSALRECCFAYLVVAKSEHCVAASAHTIDWHCKGSTLHECGALRASLERLVSTVWRQRPKTRVTLRGHYTERVWVHLTNEHCMAAAHTIDWYYCESLVLRGSV